MQIEDFGEKIGGARKDVWKARGLHIDDLLTMNDREMISNVIKNNVWKKPDYEKLLKSGESIRKLYFMKLVRDAIPTKPIIDLNSPYSLKEQCEQYINTVNQLKKDCTEIQNDSEILSFYKSKIVNVYIDSIQNSRFVEVKDEHKKAFNSKVLSAVQVFYLENLDKQIKKKQFCFSEEAKILSNYSIIKYDDNCKFIRDDYNQRTCLTVNYHFGKRFFYPTADMENENNWKKESYFIINKNRIVANNFKDENTAKQYALALEKVVKVNTEEKTGKSKKRFIPIQLQHIKRDGVDYRHGKNIKGEDYLAVFQFKGGEFGNYLNQNDRQESLNFGYDALLDLSKALNIEPKDISLNGELSIAFGARGVGNALAHYEPERVVINLTKMKGAGSLAHEWGHALDDYVGRRLSSSFTSTMASQSITSIRNQYKLPSLYKLMQTMKYGANYEYRPIKTEFYKNAIEIDANYSKSKHGYWQSNVEMFARAFACYVHDKLGYQSDYLCGHAYSGMENEKVTPYPRGKEMEDISHCFDDLFEELKQKEYLHEYIPPIEKAKDDKDFIPFETKNGQLLLFDMDYEYEKD